MLVVVVVGISHPPFDGCDSVVAELEARGVEDRVDLIGMPEPDDSAVDRGVPQRPGDGERAGRRPESLGGSR